MKLNTPRVAAIILSAFLLPTAAVGQCQNNFTEPSQLQDAINALSSSSSSSDNELCIAGPGFQGGTLCNQTTITISASVGKLTLSAEEGDNQDFTPFSFGCSSIVVESGAELVLTSTWVSAFIFQSSQTPESPIVVKEGATATLENVFFDQTTSSTFGGAIYNSGNLTVDKCNFISPSATYGGGAIYSDEMSTLLVNNTYMNFNPPDLNFVQGRAIRSAASSFELYNTQIEGNGSQQDQQYSIYLGMRQQSHYRMW